MRAVVMAESSKGGHILENLSVFQERMTAD